MPSEWRRVPNGEFHLGEVDQLSEALERSRSQLPRTALRAALGVLFIVQLPLASSLARRVARARRNERRLLQLAVDSAELERRNIAADLHEGGHDVVLIQQDPDVVAWVRATTDVEVIEADACEVTSLQRVALENYDVVVLGTGAAGLTAAIRAHAEGASVGLFEKADTAGGTAAWSGGMVWIPGNPHMAAVGAVDSREEALTYLASLSNDMIDSRAADDPAASLPDRLRRSLRERSR